MNVVRELRHHAGLTQDLLAKAAGTHSQTISEYEVGKTSPTWRMMLRLADAVGLELVVSFVPKTTEDALGTPGSRGADASPAT